MKQSMNYPFDVFGNIAVVKFPKEGSRTPTGPDKKKFANKLLSQNKPVRTILEKFGRFKGRLRKQETKYIAGEKTKEVLYRENNCVFRFNIDKTYFSPRLSNERRELSKKIKKGDNVFVMFAGIGPYSIVIAKNSKARMVFSNEINREANKYAMQNIEMNKLKGRVFLLPGDVKKIVKKLNKLKLGSLQGYSQIKLLTIKENFNLTNSKWRAEGEQSYIKIPTKFDVIVMPRPNLKENFLKEAFALSKKNTVIFYYDFCKADEIQNVLEKIKDEASEAKRKIKILNVKKAGEIAPYKFRIRIDFKVL